jgi:hypothetical protein
MGYDQSWNNIFKCAGAKVNYRCRVVASPAMADKTISLTLSSADPAPKIAASGLVLESHTIFPPFIHQEYLGASHELLRGQEAQKPDEPLHHPKGRSI